MLQNNFPKVPNDQFTKPCCVVREWIHQLSFKQQTVLLTALRGVDGAIKQDPSKNLCKAMRMTLLQNASPGQGTFMEFDLPAEDVNKFCESTDHYPVHWVMHFLYAAEIVGYKCPNVELRNWWYEFYKTLVHALHLHPESEAEMDNRLADTV